MSSSPTQESDQVDSKIADLLKVVMSLKTELSSVATQLKDLDKTIKKERKTYAVAAKKTTESVAKRKKTGLAVPRSVSDELADFMKIDKGSDVARTTVTARIVAYIKDNELEKPDNRRIILPDECLKKLFSCTDGDEVTYFNMQKFINHHFIR